MMKRISLPGLMGFLFLWLMPLEMYGQPKAGHFMYNLISYEIIDTTEVSAKDAMGLIDWMKEQFYAEVYFNKSWVVVIQNTNGGSKKSMFNRKSRVLYIYSMRDEIKRVRIDSIQAIKRNDKKLLAAIDTLKSDLQVMEYPREKRLIHGYPCHKVTATGFYNPPTLDEMWIAKFANVPDLIYPDAFYFLIEGVPLEIVQDFQDIKIKWGVVDILPVKQDDAIFKQENDGYEISIDDTAKLIYESIHFIRTYQPKTE